MVLTQQEEIKSWVKFASICRKSGKMDLSKKTLMSLLTSDEGFSELHQPISLQYPQVSWHGEEVWADGMGRRYGQMTWEEVWADGMGRRYGQMA